MGEEEWRLVRGQEGYLKGIPLVRMLYFRWSDEWDHDHCEFCWVKFMAPGDVVDPVDEAIHSVGYTNEGVDGQRDHYWWICEACFQDFRGEFRWRLLTDDSDVQS